MRTWQYENIARKLIEIEKSNSNAYERLNMKIIEMNAKIQNIDENIEKDLVKDKDLVIIYDKGTTRVYEKGEKISKIKRATFTANELPIIEYERVIY